MPCSRQSSDTGTPLSACFNIPMICASLYRLFFITISSDYHAEKILPVNTTNFRGDYHGDIMKSAFIDNVRDFQGENPVNVDIARTIKEGHFDQFVLRNNGITIVAKNIRPTSNQYLLEDYQIVNGCQTSHVIYENRALIRDTLLVPIKLIHTEDEDVAQAIIKSTNKQTLVDENDLLAFTPYRVHKTLGGACAIVNLRCPIIAASSLTFGPSAQP